MLVVTGVVISEGLLLFTTSPPHTVSCHYERILNYIAKIYIFFDISKYLGYYFVSGRQKKRETLASVLPPGSGKKIDRTTAFGVELNQSMSFKIGSLTPSSGVAPITIGLLRIGFLSNILKKNQLSNPIVKYFIFNVCT